MKNSVFPVMAMIAVVSNPTWLCAQTNTVRLPAEDRPLRAEITPRFTIGGSAATDWAAFTRIDAAAFDANGNLYLLDEPGRRVVVVRPDGSLLRELGREGAGPGEFSAPRSMAVLSDGRVAVNDVLNRRIIVFGRDGEYLTDVASAQGDGTPCGLMGSADAVIGIVCLFTVNGELQTRTSRGMQPAKDRAIQTYSIGPAGSVVLHRARVIRVPQDERGQPKLNAFFPEFAMTVLRDGRVAVSDTGAYRLTIVGRDGGVLRVVTRAGKEHPVTDAHRRAEQKRLLNNLAEGRYPQGVASAGSNSPSRAELEARFRRSIEGMAFPEIFPQITALRSDAAGRIWVGRTSGAPAGPGPIDILTGDGAYLGTLPAGEPGLPMALGPDGVAVYVELDSLDVPVVRVVRLEVRQ